MATGKSSSKRELIDTGSDKRYVRSDENGQFHESDDQGRSLSKVLGSMPKPNPNAARGIAEIADGRTDMTADGRERFERDQPHHHREADHSAKSAGETDSENDTGADHDSGRRWQS